MATMDELDRHRYLSLATFRQSGAQVATPVWFAAAGGRLYVFTSGESGKVKRLRRSPRARIAPSDARGRVRGEWHEASARLLTELRSIDRAHERCDRNTAGRCGSPMRSPASAAVSAAARGSRSNSSLDCSSIYGVRGSRVLSSGERVPSA